MILLVFPVLKEPVSMRTVLEEPVVIPRNSKLISEEI